MRRHSHAQEATSLVAELERRLSPSAMAEVRRAVKALAGKRYRFRCSEVIHPEQLALAVNLLNQGMSRADARQALMERLQIRKSKAYQLLAEALNARKVIPPTHPEPRGLRELATALDEAD